MLSPRRREIPDSGCRGLYLIIQAVLSFGLGGYIAGRIRASISTASREETEQADGIHGLGVWALAVVMGAALAALIGAASLNRTPSMRGPAQASVAEPLLSYELDRLFRAGRRANNVDLGAERAEAGRILLTTSSYSGLSTDDRSYLIQQVGALTGLSGPDAERRVDNVILSAKTAIARSRRSTVILAFSVATAILLGAVAAWATCSDQNKKPRQSGAFCLPPLASVPGVDFLFGLVFGITIPLLQTALELVLLAIYDIKVIISKFPPLLFDLALHLLPITFNAIPIHAGPPFRCP